MLDMHINTLIYLQMELKDHNCMDNDKKSKIKAQKKYACTAFNLITAKKLKSR